MGSICSIAFFSTGSKKKNKKKKIRSNSSESHAKTRCLITSSKKFLGRAWCSYSGKQYLASPPKSTWIASTLQLLTKNVTPAHSLLLWIFQRITWLLKQKQSQKIKCGIFVRRKSCGQWCCTRHELQFFYWPVYFPCESCILGLLGCVLGLFFSYLSAH